MTTSFRLQVWTTRNGTRVAVRDMTTQHLRAALDYLESDSTTGAHGRSPFINYFKKELDYRQERARTKPASVTSRLEFVEGQSVFVRPGRGEEPFISYIVRIRRGKANERLYYLASKGETAYRCHNLEDLGTSYKRLEQEAANDRLVAMDSDVNSRHNRDSIQKLCHEIHKALPIEATTGLDHSQAKTNPVWYYSTAIGQLADANRRLKKQAMKEKVASDKTDPREDLKRSEMKSLQDQLNVASKDHRVLVNDTMELVDQLADHARRLMFIEHDASQSRVFNYINLGLIAGILGGIALYISGI